MRKLLYQVIRFFGLLSCLLLLAMVGVMFLAIVMRQFGVLFEGSEEIATFSMVGLAFLGLPSVYAAGMHIRVETLYTRLSKQTQRALNVWCVLLAILVCCVFIYFTGFLAWDSYRFGDTSFGLVAIPLWIPQLPIPLGLSLLALALVDDLLSLLQGSEASFEQDAKEETSHAE